MSKYREKKIKKFKKKRFIPSIIMCLFFGFAGILLMELFLAAFYTYITNSKIDDEIDNVNKIVKYIEKQLDAGCEPEDIAKNIKEIFGEDRNLTLENKNGEVLFELGEEAPTVIVEYEKEVELEGNLEGESEQNADVEQDVGVEQETDVEQDVEQEKDVEQDAEPEKDVGQDLGVGQEKDVVQSENNYMTVMEITNGSVDAEQLGYTFDLTDMINKICEADDINDEIYTSFIWSTVELSHDGEILFVRYDIKIKQQDVIYVVGICVIFLVFLVFMILLILINLISSFVHQRRMSELLYLDNVTVGKNWLYFKERGEKILRRARRNKKSYALLDIQFTKYRNYCTFYGGEAGEELLERIYRQIQRNINKGEVFARYSKANFGVLIKFETEEELMNRIKDLISQLMELEENDKLVFHVGVCKITENSHLQGTCLDDKKINISNMGRRWSADIEHYYHHASIARAFIQEQDEKNIFVFDDKLLDEQLWKNKVEKRMEAALENQEFVVYLQPKYSSIGRRLEGAEALVRWINEEDGFIPPGKFIPIFEENGFITKLDDYMISHVAKLQSDWIKEGKNVVTISVNVSRAHFTHPNLAEHICELVDQYGTPHEVVELELTESAFFDDKKIILDTVKKLREYGFSVSMDDFGSGYSSLNSLKDLPLDVLKLDAEFFRGTDEEKRGEIIVSEAIQLAKKLDMHIVAEGIEKEEQVDFLAKQGCDMIQGYYFAKPMPIEEFEANHLAKI